MPMPNWDEGVRNLPIRVRFLGFESDTQQLARQGWALSMREEQKFSYDVHTLQLAMRFQPSSGPGIYGYSAPLPIRNEDVHRYAAGQDHPMQIMSMLGAYGFDIIHVGNAPQFQVYPVRARAAYWSHEFNPISAEPEFSARIESMADFKFFTPIKPNVKDLIVSPNDVPELMELVLKAQRPVIDDVKKRERSRANEDWMRSGMELKPAREVHAQIISLASA